MKNGIPAAMSVNKDTPVVSDCSRSVWAGECWGTWEEAYHQSGSRQTAAPPQGEHPGSSGCGQHRVLALIAEMNVKGILFQWAQTLASSHTQKNTKSLNLKYLVFFNNNISMFRLPALCCKTSIWPSSSLRLPRALLSGLLEILFVGFDILNIPTE